MKKIIPIFILEKQKELLNPLKKHSISIVFHHLYINEIIKKILDIKKNNFFINKKIIAKKKFIVTNEITIGQGDIDKL